MNWRYPLYEVRKGFTPPSADLDTWLPEAIPCYEVWRRKTLFRKEQHIETFNHKWAAKAALRCLNGHKWDDAQKRKEQG